MPFNHESTKMRRGDLFKRNNKTQHNGNQIFSLNEHRIDVILDVDDPERRRAPLTFSKSGLWMGGCTETEGD